MSAPPANLEPTVRRLLVAHAQADAFAPHARSILTRAGYRIVGIDELDSLPEALAGRRPDLRIVDERRLAEVPEEEEGDSVPIVLLTGRHGTAGADPRIVGAVPRPAGLHELFRVLQAVLAETPRTTPRVATHLPARCRRGSREWSAAVLSLSENGALVRCAEPLALRSEIEIEFSLPRSGNVGTGAEVAYQLLPDLGLVFHSTPVAVRRAIAEYVNDATLPASRVRG